MIRVQIVETIPIYLIGLVSLYSQQEFEVAGTATSTSDHLSWQADVIIVDSQAVNTGPESGALTQVARIAPVIVMADDVSDQFVDQCAQAGAAAVIERSASAAVVHETTRKTVRGKDFRNCVSPGVALAPAARKSALSPREQQVLQHVARGLTHYEIARLLNISQHTVETYVKRIRGKVGQGNKAVLTRAAVLGNLH